MLSLLYFLVVLVLLPPLMSAVLTGLCCQRLRPRTAHVLTINGILISLIASLFLAWIFFVDGEMATQIVLYNWMKTGPFDFKISCLLDRLSVLMIIFVNFVSLMVHIYSIGYMRHDSGYQRFFSYVSLFTFAMLVLVLADNFLLLFFGWEGVGLVSYLLIGFWFTRAAAVAGSFKAFLVNRIADVGFIIGIACIFAYFDTLDYLQVFAKAPQLAHTMISFIPGTSWSLISVVCLLLLFGAMGKSAQMPLHVWLPESMEGPTPISALIHAATMVTAGIYLIVRLSPLFVLSPTALSVILIVGATTALFTGLLGLVQHDLKRVIAYSTLSQLGYMIAACGAGAFSAAFFHLLTHACFKALLFLAAGSVIIALHHEQDLRHMGGLRKFMPITYITFLIGALALAAIPPFSGFFSKESIIEAVASSTVVGASYAYICLLAGAFITALYIFRAFFLTFHTRERITADARRHVRESPYSMLAPLIALSIPSVCLGWWLFKPLLYDHSALWGSTVVLPSALSNATSITGISLIVNAVSHHSFWLAVSGIFVAWIGYIVCPALPAIITRIFSVPYQILVRKYGFDDFNQFILVRGTLSLARVLFKQGDVRILDNYLVNGTARLINACSLLSRYVQTGYLYHYALAMVIGLLFFLGWFLLR